MLERLYINKKLVTPYPSDEIIRQAVEAGSLVVAVDGGGVAVQITREMLAKSHIKK